MMDMMYIMNRIPEHTIPLTTHELRTDLPNILSRIENGDTFTLTNYGRPVAIITGTAPTAASLAILRDQYTREASIAHNAGNQTAVNNALATVRALTAAIGNMHDTQNH